MLRKVVLFPPAIRSWENEQRLSNEEWGLMSAKPAP